MDAKDKAEIFRDLANLVDECYPYHADQEVQQFVNRLVDRLHAVAKHLNDEAT